MLDNRQHTEEMVEIPHDYLVKGVRKAVANVEAFLAKARKQYGDFYYRNNEYEAFSRRFGYDDAEKIWQEYTLVANKRSGQPAAVRHVIRELGSRGRAYAIIRMRQDLQAGKQKS